MRVLGALCSFDGVFDLHPLLEAVGRGRMLHPLQLNGVASTLQVRLLLPCRLLFQYWQPCVKFRQATVAMYGRQGKL